MLYKLVYSVIFHMYCFCADFFFFSSRRRHTRCSRDWSSDVCSSDLPIRETSSPTSSIRFPNGTTSAISSVKARGRSEERREGKSVDLGGRRTIKKKKEKKKN